MKKYYCVISLVSEQNMSLYKGEVEANQKPEDSFWGDKGFSIGIDYFDSKKERDNFYACNDMSVEVSKRSFGDKTFYSVISVVSDQEMKMFKGKVRATTKPSDMFKGDRKLSLDIEYFSRKKDRDRFFECNDIGVDGYKLSSQQSTFKTPEREVAVKSGYYFNVIAESELEGIELDSTGVKVHVNGEDYELQCGKTFPDSRKVDELLDKYGDLPINDYRVENVKLDDRVSAAKEIAEEVPAKVKGAKDFVK